MRPLTLLVFFLYSSLHNSSHIQAVNSTHLKKVPKVYKQQAAVIVLWCQVPSAGFRKYFKTHQECGKKMVKPVRTCWEQAEIESQIKGSFPEKLSQCVSLKLKRLVSSVQ